MKKYIFIITIIILLLSGNSVYAQAARQLGVDYPDIPYAQTTPETEDTPIPEYFQYIYYFFLISAGALAVLIVVVGGVQYLLSAGNPGKMQDAKERIVSALLGLLLLVGSYGILYSINPRLILFDVEEIRPIIPALPKGVLLCRGGNSPIMEAWDLEEEYYYTNPSVARAREIREQLTIYIEQILEECYVVQGAESLPPGFDNEARFVWFVPIRTPDGDWRNSTEFGAVVYDETDFSGYSQPIYEHLIDPHGYIIPYRAPLAGSAWVSSVKPFKLIYEPSEQWEVILYEEDNYNEGYEEGEKETIPGDPPPGLRLSPNYWYCTDGSITGAAAPCINAVGNWGWSPKSMETEGDLLTILVYPPRSESFFSQRIRDLEAFDNIIVWERCEGYQGERRGRWRSECAHAASTGIVILSAEPL